MTRTLRYAMLIPASALLMAACATQQNIGAEDAGPGGHDHHVRIVRTAEGTPHIRASNWQDLGYGYGYVQAQDDLCTMAQAFVTYRGARSQYFGADGHGDSTSSFGMPRNLDADFFFRFMLDDAAVARYRAAQTAPMQKLVNGFAEGYDRYVGELAHGAHAGAQSQCRGQPWVMPISADDVYRRLMAAMLAGGATRFIGAIANAHPPEAGVALPGPAAAAGQPRDGGATPEAQTLAAQFEVGGGHGIGSNALAFGAGETRDRQSLLFGNPHWFWRGPDRFYQAQLTIPGQIDVAGVSFLGVPVIVMGFNRNVAWTHTVSTARRFGVFELKLVPGHPTQYLYDGRVQDLDAVPVTVQVRHADGTLAPVTRTLYRSRFGPLVDLSSTAKPLQWSNAHAFALHDVNADNAEAFENFLQWGRAGSLDAFIATQKHFAAMPWVNTVAIGRDDPRVWYADIGAVPNVPDALAARCTTALGHAFDAMVPGVPFFDGSRSECAWSGAPVAASHDEARKARLPVQAMPSLLREDYVGNFNGSFWLSNPAAPLTGYASIMGETGTAQSLRTRLGHTIAAQLLAQPGGVTREALERRVLDSESMSATLLRKPVLDALCTTRTLVNGVDLSEACNVLRGWDGSGNAQARGANLWDAFWREASKIPAQQLYATPFDPARPLDTPAGLKADDPMVKAALTQALAKAVETLKKAGLALDSTRAQWLYSQRGDVRYPLYGGCDYAGYFTSACMEGMIPRSATAPDGDLHGNSYMQVVGFGEQGPQADTMMAPSESNDPASANFAEGTARYAHKIWTRFLFDQAAAEAAKGSRTEVLDSTQ
ncbi:penicillin acylase family protein [Paraburkholderia bannensis]|uniref:penicillin acylase family protein n=1 Tax=Paraburkholderia bannensis TaxID=765414 RepID=UPI0005A94544|nr:penicillin acylase family protein [Paraburkholderia bannensis]